MGKIVVRHEGVHVAMFNGPAGAAGGSIPQGAAMAATGAHPQSPKEGRRSKITFALALYHSIMRVAPHLKAQVQPRRGLGSELMSLQLSSAAGAPAPIGTSGAKALAEAMKAGVVPKLRVLQLQRQPHPDQYAAGVAVAVRGLGLVPYA